MAEIKDRVICTDEFGTYINEPGVVVGFSKNMFERKLVEVQLDLNNEFGYGPSTFYESEIRPE